MTGESGEGNLKKKVSGNLLDLQNSKKDKKSGPRRGLRRGLGGYLPQIGGHLGPEDGEGVVGVHEDVDEGVDEREEGVGAARHELEADPDETGHQRVVDDVQRRHLRRLLAQDEEDGVGELDELGEEEEPAHEQLAQLGPVRLPAVVDRLAAPGVEAEVQQQHA